ncbi:MAG: hypothetical protein QS721_13665 [Candidatus Endonucleobacter sp. (ex Gigantidas childressi)]|nr:hypothetical protein [Candidatus Endonucleobacter sp. (ex Gigantidas childressi)]
MFADCDWLVLHIKTTTDFYFPVMFCYHPAVLDARDKKSGTTLVF